MEVFSTLELTGQEKELNPSYIEEFKIVMESLISAARQQMYDEENDIFEKIHSNFSDEQEKRLATEFISAKSKIQNDRLENL